MAFRFVGFTIVGILIAIGVVGAQEPAPLSIQVHVNLVNLAFVARDATGTLRRDLTADDIEVFEDGVQQLLKFFNRSEDVPLQLALVVDASESQGKFMKQHKQDIHAFVEESLASGDRALLVCFGNHIRVASDFSSSASDLVEALDQYEKKGGHKLVELEPDNTRVDGTALFDAVYLTALEKLQPVVAGRKARILFSDGEDNSSAHDLMDAIAAAQSTGALIYTVRYTETHHGKLTSRNRYGIREMDRLANETGGVAFDASKDDVAGSLKQVTEELRAMYEIGYVSTNSARDHLFRKVEIRPKRQGIVLRSKTGYYAP